jgi:TFIIF-interacting CTD phosphatase-like protein
MRALLLPFHAIMAGILINAFIPSKVAPWKSHSSKILHGVRRSLCSKDSDSSKESPNPDKAAEVRESFVPLVSRMVKDFDPDRQSNVDKWRLEFPTCKIPDDSPLLLPEIREEDRGKKCLVLDLDDTLIYTDNRKNEHDADIYFTVEVQIEVQRISVH